MKELVKIDGEKAFTTSLVISEGVHVEHRAVMRLIKEYREDFNDISLKTFQMTKVKTLGRSIEVAILDELQATFLITLMKNSKIVVEFKKKLTKEFFKQRETLARIIFDQKNPDWQNARKDGKVIYKQKTEVIKDFVEYATSQGSKNASRYYSNFAKMENSALFFFEQKYKNMREVLTIKQLMQVATADDVIEKALQEGMDENFDYHDIYKLAKKRIIAFSDIIGKSPVLELSNMKSLK